MFSSLDEYEKEYYAAAEVKLLQDFNHWLGVNEEESKIKWLAAMEDILHKAAQAQTKLKEEGQCVNCRYLQCSFLYVSLYQDGMWKYLRPSRFQSGWHQLQGVPCWL